MVGRGDSKEYPQRGLRVSGSRPECMYAYGLCAEHSWNVRTDSATITALTRLSAARRVPTTQLEDLGIIPSQE
jgi:hypothetical protein